MLAATKRVNIGASFNQKPQDSLPRGTKRRACSKARSVAGGGGMRVRAGEEEPEALKVDLFKGDLGVSRLANRYLGFAS